LGPLTTEWMNLDVFCKLRPILKDFLVYQMVRRHVARMPKSAKKKRPCDGYRLPGFHPSVSVRGLFGDPRARVIALPDAQKTTCGDCGRTQSGWYDRKLRRVRDLPCGGTRIYLELAIRRVDCRSCQGVKQERLDWLARPIMRSRC
jgi:hypothetical protein